MKFPYLIFLFFTLFFVLQLVFGEAGIIAFIQEKYITQKVAKNVVILRTIQEDLKKKESLAHRNRSYMRMNAHRVGLLSKDEYLITLDSPLFVESVSYSPGVVIANKSVVYISNAVLFFISLALYFLAVAFYILKRNCIKSNRMIASTVGNADSIKIPLSQSVIDNSGEYNVLAINGEHATIFSDTETSQVATKYTSLYGDEEDQYQMEKSLWQAST